MLKRKMVKESEWKSLNQAMLEAKEQNNQLRERNQILEANLRLMWKDESCNPVKIFKEFQLWLMGDPNKGIKPKLQFPMPTFVFKDFIRQYKVKK